MCLVRFEICLVLQFIFSAINAELQPGFLGKGKRTSSFYLTVKGILNQHQSKHLPVVFFLLHKISSSEQNGPIKLSCLMALKMVRDSPLICKRFLVQLNLEPRSSFALGKVSRHYYIHRSDNINTSRNFFFPCFVSKPYTFWSVRHPRFLFHLFNKS